MKAGLKILFLVFIAVVFVACGSGFNEGENYGDLLSSPEGLVLTPDEHRGGWGRADCFFCHPIHNLHLENRASAPINMEEIRFQVITQGLNSCPTCHGTNGLGTF